MFIIKLTGGLANQMFQYAFGQNIAVSYNKKVVYDIGAYKYRSKNDTYRDYQLYQFGIELDTINNALSTIINNKNSSFYSFIYKVFKRVRLVKEFKEKELYVYDNSFYNQTGIVYFKGFWQSCKYFSKIRNKLIETFVNKPNISSKVQKIKGQLSETNSVAIHFRRGDYLTNNTAKQFHGICNLDYYYNAVNYLIKSCVNISLYIFSDDIQWVKQHFKVDVPIFFVEGNDDFEDIILMASAKHNIIANSSFSWWGAYLNQNENKTVIAPANWTKKHKSKDIDLIPKEWVIL